MKVKVTSSAYPFSASEKKRFGATIKKRKQVLSDGTSFKTVAENSPDVICRFDPRLYHLYVNPAIERITGVPQQAFIGKRPHDLPLPDAVKEHWIKHLEFVFKTAQQTTMEFSFPSMEQGERVFQSLLIPEFNDNGKVTSVLSFSRDITPMKERERNREEVVGMVSHELKTPVTSLKALTQIMRAQLLAIGDVTTASQLKKMDTQLTRLTKLISDLHDATKLETGTVRLEITPFDLNELIVEIVENVSRVYPTHLVTVNGKVTKGVMGDRERIGQVLTNLLTNAMKFSHDTSPVTVNVKQTNTEVIVSVTDQGIGISKAKQKKVFERFYRISEKNQPIYPGLGLGLFIASEIVKGHKGRIWVESTLKKGSTFSFSIPLS